MGGPDCVLTFERRHKFRHQSAERIQMEALGALQRGPPAFSAISIVWHLSQVQPECDAAWLGDVDRLRQLASRGLV